MTSHGKEGPMTDDRTTAERFFEELARAEQVIWIPGAVADPESPPEVFATFCQELPEHTDAQLYRQLPQLARFADAEYDPEPEEVARVLLDTQGFLVQAATPIRRHFTEPGGCQFSWGYYATEWLYAATVDDLEQVILVWVKAEVERQRSHDTERREIAPMTAASSRP